MHPILLYSNQQNYSTWTLTTTTWSPVLRPVMMQSFWSACVLVPECCTTRRARCDGRTFQRSARPCRNLPMTSCRTIELRSSRHSKRSIVCSRVGSQRDSRWVSGLDRLALSTASTWMGDAKTRENDIVDRQDPSDGNREIHAGFLLTLAVTSCSVRRRFQVSGGIFSVMDFVVRKSIRAKLSFEEKRGREEATGQEIAEAVRVLCIHAQFTADQTVRQRRVKKKEIRQLILYSADHIFSSSVI